VGDCGEAVGNREVVVAVTASGKRRWLGKGYGKGSGKGQREEIVSGLDLGKSVVDRLLDGGCGQWITGEGQWRNW